MSDRTNYDLELLKKKQKLIENKMKIYDLRIENQLIEQELKNINRLRMNPKSLVNIFKSKYHMRSKKNNTSKDNKDNKDNK